MNTLRKSSFLLINLLFGILFFLPQNSYAGAPVSDGFDFPLGRPDGAGYGVECCGGLAWLERYDYEGDGTKEYHPGEDWNGVGQDAGDPVYAASDGVIVYARYAEQDWGYLVLIEHQLRNGEKLWSQYGHLKNISPEFINKVGKVAKRGEVIGWVGDYRHGSGRAYHLHFEIRKKYRKANEFVFDWSKEKVQEYYVSPSEFIRNNRPLPPPVAQKLSLVTAGQGKAELSWDECLDPAFERYELYRSEVAGGTGDQSKRQTLTSSTDLKALEYTDDKLYAGQNYYYGLATYYKNGRVATSNEVTVNIARESINISNKAGVQRFVGASKGKVYWEEYEREQTNFPEKRTFYYYDLTEKTVKTIQIGGSVTKIQGPYKPQVAGDWLCYYGLTSRYGKYQVFCRNLASDMPADLHISLIDGNNVDPQVSEDGTVVWRGGADGRLYWANLNDGTEVHELTESTALEPRIWGKNVIYHVRATTNTQDLWMVNIETGAKTLLKAGVDVGFSDIWEDKVVYSKDKDVYLASLSDPTRETLLAKDGQKNARIRDGKVVYSKIAPDGKPHVYVYIISSAKAIEIAGPLNTQPLPVIFENSVAYNDYIDTPANMEIFLTFL